MAETKMSLSTTRPPTSSILHHTPTKHKRYTTTPETRTSRSLWYRHPSSSMIEADGRQKGFRQVTKSTWGRGVGGWGGGGNTSGIHLENFYNHQASLSWDLRLASVSCPPLRSELLTTTLLCLLSTERHRLSVPHLVPRLLCTPMSPKMGTKTIYQTISWEGSAKAVVRNIWANNPFGETNDPFKGPYQMSCISDIMIH